MAMIHFLVKTLLGLVFFAPGLLQCRVSLVGHLRSGFNFSFALFKSRVKSANSGFCVPDFGVGSFEFKCVEVSELGSLGGKRTKQQKGV